MSHHYAAGILVKMDTSADAENKLHIADHLLSTTYSLVKEPKLLLSILENILAAFDIAITGALRRAQLKATSFEEKLDLFRRKIASKHNLNPKIIEFVTEIKSILEQHKQAAVEFKRKEHLIISDNDFNIKSLSPEECKQKLKLAKEYIAQISQV